MLLLCFSNFVSFKFLADIFGLLFTCICRVAATKSPVIYTGTGEHKCRQGRLNGSGVSIPSLSLPPNTNSDSRHSSVLPRSASEGRINCYSPTNYYGFELDFMGPVAAVLVGFLCVFRLFPEEVELPDAIVLSVCNVYCFFFVCKTAYFEQKIIKY